MPGRVLRKHWKARDAFTQRVYEALDFIAAREKKKTDELGEDRIRDLLGLHDENDRTRFPNIKSGRNSVTLDMLGALAKTGRISGNWLLTGEHKIDDAHDALERLEARRHDAVSRLADKLMVEPSGEPREHGWLFRLLNVSFDYFLYMRQFGYAKALQDHLDEFVERMADARLAMELSDFVQRNPEVAQRGLIGLFIPKVPKVEPETEKQSMPPAPRHKKVPVKQRKKKS